MRKSYHNPKVIYIKIGIKTGTHGVEKCQTSLDYFKKRFIANNSKIKDKKKSFKTKK